jgi:anti-sigma regulatory factor (Ser/Thr protein kinase)
LFRVKVGFPPLPSSVPRARAAITDTVRSWGADVDPDILQLAVSEVVTNAVHHGGGPLTVEVVWLDHDLRVGVTDDNPGTVPRLVIAAADAESGRGLHILEAITEAWGVERDGDHKTVWFRLPTGLGAPTD